MTTPSQNRIFIILVTIAACVVVLLAVIFKFKAQSSFLRENAIQKRLMTEAHIKQLTDAHNELKMYFRRSVTEGDYSKTTLTAIRSQIERVQNNYLFHYIDINKDYDLMRVNMTRWYESANLKKSYENVWGSSETEIHQFSELNATVFDHWWQESKRRFSFGEEAEDTSFLLNSPVIVSVGKEFDQSLAYMLNEVENHIIRAVNFNKNVTTAGLLDAHVDSWSLHFDLSNRFEKAVFLIRDHLIENIQKQNQIMTAVIGEIHQSFDRIDQRLGLIRLSLDQQQFAEHYQIEAFEEKSLWFQTGVVSLIMIGVIVIFMLFSGYQHKLTRLITKLGVGAQDTVLMTSALMRSFKNSALFLRQKNQQFNQKLSSMLALVDKCISDEVVDGAEGSSSEPILTKQRNAQDVKQLKQLMQDVRRQSMDLSGDIHNLDQQAKASIMLNDQCEVLQDAVTSIAHMTNHEVQLIPGQDFKGTDRRNVPDQSKHLHQYFDMLMSSEAHFDDENVSERIKLISKRTP